MNRRESKAGEFAGKSGQHGARRTSIISIHGKGNKNKCLQNYEHFVQILIESIEEKNLITS